MELLSKVKNAFTVIQHAKLVTALLYIVALVVSMAYQSFMKTIYSVVLVYATMTSILIRMVVVIMGKSIMNASLGSIKMITMNVNLVMIIARLAMANHIYVHHATIISC